VLIRRTHWPEEHSYSSYLQQKFVPQQINPELQKSRGSIVRHLTYAKENFKLQK
jgi:hypothetical protein